MSVMICGEDRTRLKVMGDIEAELPVPAESAVTPLNPDTLTAVGLSMVDPLPS